MTHYTASHWGIYQVDAGMDGAPKLTPYSGDSDPSPIGLHQLDDSLMRLRVRRPAVRRSWLRDGPGAAPELRGREPFVEVEWEEAERLVAGEIGRVREQHGNQAIFGGSYGWSSAGRFHHAQSQVHRFLNACGGYVRHADSYSLGAARVLLPYVVASMEELQASHTSWDVLAEHTTLFVSFGGVPAKNAQIPAGGVADHRIPAALRRMQVAGTRFVNIGPVGDNLDAGSGVEWLRIPPHTDTAFMLALAWVLRDEGLHDTGFLASHCTGYETFERYLLGLDDGVPKTPDWAAKITRVPPAQVATLARDMAAQRTMLNIAWSLQRATSGEQPFWMLITLACMLGQVGLPGGGFGVGYGATNLMGSPQIRLAGPTLSQGRNAVDAFIPVARISDMLLHPGDPFTYNGATYRYPDIRLVYWAGGNPFHHHQDLNRLLRAWRKPETIVVNEQFWTPTAKLADVVLPATTSMERNDLGYATREGHLVAMRQVIPKVGEARDDYAIFAALAKRLGAEEAYTEGLDEMGWLVRLYEECRERARAMKVSLPTFDAFWQQGVVDMGAHAAPVVMLDAFRADPVAHRLRTPSGRIEIGSDRIAGFAIPDCPGHAVWREPAEWLGGALAAKFPLHLLSDQPVLRLHSQLDASLHSQAGKIAGREPIDVNPADATARGLADGEVVEVYNDRGRCLAAVRLSTDVMPGVVKLSTGAWFDPDWEGGPERHGNPNALTLDVGSSGLSQGCSAQTCLVELRAAALPLPPVTAFMLPPLTGER